MVCYQFGRSSIIYALISQSKPVNMDNKTSASLCPLDHDWTVYTKFMETMWPQDGYYHEPGQQNKEIAFQDNITSTNF